MNKNFLIALIALCIFGLSITGVVMLNDKDLPANEGIEDKIILSEGMGVKKTIAPQTYEDKASAFLKQVQEDVNAINICFGQDNIVGLKEALDVYYKDLKTWEDKKEKEPKSYVGFYKNLYSVYISWKTAYACKVNLANGGTEDIKTMQKALDEASTYMQKALDIYNKASADKICK